eukprot:1153934-Pelagomonas_calceolata.AAC.2
MVEPSRLVQHPAGAAMGPVGNTAQVNCTTQEAMEGGDAGAVGHHPPSPGDAFQQALDQPAGNGGVDRPVSDTACEYLCIPYTPRLTKLAPESILSDEFYWPPQWSHMQGPGWGQGLLFSLDTLVFVSQSHPTSPPPVRVAHCLCWRLYLLIRPLILVPAGGCDGLGRAFHIPHKSVGSKTLYTFFLFPSFMPQVATFDAQPDAVCTINPSGAM